MSDYIKQQHEARQRAWEEAKSLLDAAAAEKRDLTAEENEKYERISSDLDKRAQVIETLKADAEREERALTSMKGFEDQARPADADAYSKDDAEAIRALATGEIRSYEFEKRDVLKSSTGSPVPTSFFDQVLLIARTVGPMLDTSTVLNTASGENLQIPSLSTYSSGTPFAESIAIGESDPVFNSFVTLSAYKYAFLTQISRELVEDSGINILSFLADQVGNSLGFDVNKGLTVGTGSTEPTGLTTRTTLGVQGTAANYLPTADELIDLVYSVETVGRRLAGSGFQMNKSLIANVRKLKDGQGQFLFSPSLNADANDLLLGYPIFENPAMGSAGSVVKSVIFGHLPSYYVRSVGGIKLDRSDDYAFNNDLVTFRATFRVDGNLIQTSHIKHFRGKDA
jgi:HK97 family phage major capsid protein